VVHQVGKLNIDLSVSLPSVLLFYYTLVTYSIVLSDIVYCHIMWCDMTDIMSDICDRM